MFICLCSCGSDKENISVWIENNSDVNREIEVSTYLNDSLVDKRYIEKDSIADRVASFKIDLKLAGKKKESKFKFVSSIDQDQTSCVVNLDSINKSTLLHVNYVRRLLRKGYHFNNDTLKSDSIIRKEFYCELIKGNK